MATSNPKLAQTNLLAELDGATQEVIDAIVEAQGHAIELEGLPMPTVFSRHMSLAEMRRQKRAFVKLATQNSFSKLQNVECSKAMFLDFLLKAAQ